MTNDAADQYLILMKGFPATGKSALAHRLSRRLGWPVVNKDDIKDYTLHVKNGNALAYDIMWAVVHRQLQLGLSVIVDSPLTYPEGFRTGQALAAAHGARLLVVETRLSDAEWRRRLEARDRRESEHKIAGWNSMQALLARYDGCWRYAIPPDSHIVVDTAQPVERAALTVLSRLGLHKSADDRAGHVQTPSGTER